MNGFWWGMVAGISLTLFCAYLVLRFRQPILEAMSAILTDCDGCICGDTNHSTSCMKIRFVEREKTRRGKPREATVVNFRPEEVMAKKS